MFSVIITCYNEGLELRRAVESVRRQTYTDYEIIVVKDFSDHAETLQVCRELEQEGIQVLYAEKNVGVSITRNMGIAEAKGDYIYTAFGFSSKVRAICSNASTGNSSSPSTV